MTLWYKNTINIFSDVYDALMRFYVVSWGKTQKVKNDLFQEGVFLTVFSILFAPIDVFINRILKVLSDFLCGLSLECDDIVRVSDAPVKHIFCLIKLKMANKSFIFSHHSPDF